MCIDWLAEVSLHQPFENLQRKYSHFSFINKRWLGYLQEEICILYVILHKTNHSSAERYSLCGET